MRKILIVDDRLERQKSLLGEAEFEKLKGIPAVEFEHELPKERELYQFSLLIFHLSYLKEIGRLSEIVDYARKQQKMLILFSGGITQNVLAEEGRRLTINSRDFYSPQLVPFLEGFSDESKNDKLTQLLYGENWKLPLLIQYRHLLWQYGSSLDKIEREIDSLHELLGNEAKDKDTLNKSIEKYFNKF